MKIKHAVKLALLTTLVVSLIGCQATRRTLNFDTRAELNLSAFNNINPDNDGRSSPLVIRVFKLADARQFTREDFLNLYENPDDRLGNDLIDTVILKELAPGENRIEFLELTPDIRYIGFLAEFVQYQDARATMVLPIQEHSKNKFNIMIDGLTLTHDKSREYSRIKRRGYDLSIDGEQARSDINQLRRDRDTIKSEIDAFK